MTNKYLNKYLFFKFKIIFFVFFTISLHAEDAPNSPFINEEMFEAFNEVSIETKKKLCGYDEKFFISWGNIDINLPNKIKGYNSKKDNQYDVEGYHAEYVLQEFSKAATYSLITKDKEIKERLFNKLYEWTKDDALLNTRQCLVRNHERTVKEGQCENYWRDKNGQDPAPMHDDTEAAMIAHNFFQIYHTYFVNYKINDIRHDAIKSWLKKWEKRTPLHLKFGFGVYMDWAIPNINFKYYQDKDFRGLVKNLLNNINRNILKDGSIRNRTTRGDRALWYHTTALGEISYAIELAYINDVKISDELLDKYAKALDIMVKTLEDNDYIIPWAQKAFNSTFDKNNPGYQDFPKNLDKYSSNALFLHSLQYRFPDSPISKYLKNNVSSKAYSLQLDNWTGISFNCIHKVLAEKNIEKKAENDLLNWLDNAS
tara:strand:- start:1019 stop:2299 length:1281 start_codon:yes stop_codon:yes gene_type:complete